MAYTFNETAPVEATEKEQQLTSASVIPEEKPKSEEVSESKQKKRRGNPQDFSKLTRNKQVKFWLTEEEKIELKAAADAAGMGMSDFIMSCVRLEHQVVVLDGSKIRTDLIKVGHNMNQATMLCHKAKKKNVNVPYFYLEKTAEAVNECIEKVETYFAMWNAEVWKRASALDEEGRKDANN